MTPGLPRISIVIPSFNHGSYLETSIRSVLDQGYPEAEVIVMDGGSSDGSADIIRRHGPRLFHWESAPDAGAGDAIRRGFALATGELLAVLPADDLLLPGSLLAVGRHMARHPRTECVTGDCLEIDGEGRVRRSGKGSPIYRIGCRENFPLIMARGYVASPTMSSFWRRSAYLEVGGWDPSWKIADDLDLFIRLARRRRFDYLPRFLSCFRIHAAGKTTMVRAQCLEETDRLIRHHWEASPRGPVAMGRARLQLKALRLKERWLHLLLRLGVFRLPQPPAGRVAP